MRDATIEGHEPRAPVIRARPALGLLALFLGVGLAQGVAVRFALVAEGASLAEHAPIVGHLTGALAAYLALPIVQVATARAPGPRVGWPRFAATHLVGYAAFAAAHLALMLALRAGLDCLGVDTPSRPLGFQALWEVQSDLIVYTGLATLWILLRAWDERRAAALRAAKLEAQLAAARLDALTAGVNPHFLFNALNTISAVMYEDLPRTERLLASLGALLRASIGPGGATWTLAEERDHTARYVELLAARFGERLRVTWAIEPGLSDLSVPRFALQSLVENAVKHNQDRAAPLSIELRGAARAGELILEVADDGRGLSPAAVEARGGLSRLAETLALLHGPRARLER
ncbi:MAG: histidine kinase, partial [Myxococcales bacterium]|nr:histidine kinase [Myxococcales bacterium]